MHIFPFLSFTVEPTGVVSLESDLNISVVVYCKTEHLFSWIVTMEVYSIYPRSPLAQIHRLAAAKYTR